jgi:protein arginine N-methyltransferase 1
MIPHRITQFVAPVVTPRIDTELRAWGRVGHGLDLSVAETMSLNNAYVRSLKPAELLDEGASAKSWDVVELGADTRANRKGEANWSVKKAATVYGFACWWTAELTAGVSLSTAPGAPPTHWEQLYFPLLKPITLKARETVIVSLRSSSSEAAGTHLAWTAVHFDTQGRSLARQALDLDKGFLP